jgi:hypothetical protein
MSEVDRWAVVELVVPLRPIRLDEVFLKHAHVFAVHAVVNLDSTNIASTETIRVHADSSKTFSERPT